MPTASMEDPKKKIAHKRYTLKCKFSPDSTMLVTASADQTAKVWRTTDLKLITVNFFHLYLNIIGNINFLYSIEELRSRIFSALIKFLLLPWQELNAENQRWVWDVAFSADSQYLFTASSDNMARFVQNFTFGTTYGLGRPFKGHSNNMWHFLALSDPLAKIWSPKRLWTVK